MIERLADQRHRWLWVLAASGLLGFRIGSVGFPTWQVAVETAQVVAGLVTYPSGNPFYIYHTKLWTILHQICAVLLRAGVSEIVLSKVLSGVIGMISFQALALFVYSLAPDVLLAVGAPAFIFFTRAAEHGTIYPINLLGTSHTYGAIGLSFVALVVALFGVGAVRAAGFLLGLAPAVHPSLGAWLGLIVGVSFAWDFRKLRDDFRPALKYFLAGCAITAISLLIQLTLTYDVPKVDPGVTARYIAGFVSGFDEHRRPTRLLSVGLIANGNALVLSLIWLKLFSEDLPRHGLFVLRAFAVSAALSLCAMFISWLPPDRVPTTLLILIPSRFLNFDTFGFVALLLGLLGAYRQKLRSQVLIASLLVALFFSYRSMLWDGFPGNGWIVRQLQFNPWHVFQATSIALAATLGISAWFARRVHAAPSMTAATGSPAILAATRVARVVSLAVLAWSVVLSWKLSQREIFSDRTNDPFYHAVAAEKRGVIATAGSYHLVQLYTRRPVLLDGGALDMLPYAPEGGPEMERILREVYGIDFFNPPPGARGSPYISHDFTRPVWESYSRQKWQEIGRRFNVTQVLTRVQWSLDLPVAAQNRYFRLFRIPDDE